MPKFRKKPVVIDAWQVHFDEAGTVSEDTAPDWVKTALCGHRLYAGLQCLMVDTWEGEMAAQPGDWIARGVRGELYPIKGDIFAETYEAVD